MFRLHFQAGYTLKMIWGGFSGKTKGQPLYCGPVRMGWRELAMGAQNHGENAGFLFRNSLRLGWF